MKEINTYDDNLEGGKLPDFSAVNPFTVPSDYFEEAAAQIKSICKLPHIDHDAHPADDTLPNTYFDDLTTQIKLRISLDDILSDNKNLGFDVPTNYFLDAQEEIISTVKLHRILPVALEDGFAVDRNYFDSLSARITQRIAIEDQDNEKPSAPTPVVSIQRWMKYTAAASLLFVLSMGAYFGLNSEQEVAPAAQTVAVEASLSEISDDELMNYLAYDNDHDELQYYVDYLYENDEDQDEEACSKLEDKDLEAYIKHML